MLGKAIHILRSRGISGLARAADSRLRGLFAGRAKAFHAYGKRFTGKRGLEIGGPSQAFYENGIFPIYPIVAHLDNCNFSNTTVWEGNIQEGRTFQYNRNCPPGLQYIIEATALDDLAPTSYDFVLASHVLEHIANPVLALSVWKRLLKMDGTLILLLPDKNHTFDHRRPVTTMAHLIEDFNKGVGEDDLTHLPEILDLHDLDRDPEAGEMAAFKSRSLRNAENRCLHHHVFDMELAVSLVEHVGLKAIAVEKVQPHHILLLAS